MLPAAAATPLTAIAISGILQNYNYVATLVRDNFLSL